MNAAEIYLKALLDIFDGTLDQNIDALQISDHEHSEIHEGDHFYYTDAVTLASAGVQSYLLTTPDTAELINMTFMATGSAITQVELLEGGNRVGTTLQTTFNSHRQSLNVSDMTIHKGISGGTTDGTLIWIMKSGSAQGASRVGMSADRVHEFILKRNTKYMIRITSGTADNLANIQLAWYKH